MIFIVMLSMHFASSLSQRIERVHGEYTYHVPENVALEEGRRIALERAKIQALADAFGTTVSQNNSTYVKNINGKSSVDFISLGGSEVKGEWIETIGEPTYKIYYERKMLVVEVYVNGMETSHLMSFISGKPSWRSPFSAISSRVLPS